MSKKVYHKIVRDKIPEIIEEAGKKPEYEFVSKEETILGLEEKLQEEMNEYLESKDAEELADIAEVLCGIAYHRYGMTPEELDELRQRKRNARGGFEKGIRLLGVEE